MCQNFQVVSSPMQHHVCPRSKQHTRKIVCANRQLRRKFCDHQQHCNLSFGPKGRFSCQQVFQPQNHARPWRLPRPKFCCCCSSRAKACHSFDLERITSCLNKAINDHATENNIHQFHVHHCSGLMRKHESQQKSGCAAMPINHCNSTLRIWPDNPVHSTEINLDKSSSVSDVFGEANITEHTQTQR